MLLDRSSIHVESIQRQAFVPERTEHEVLDGVLCAANGWEANERLGKFYLLGETFFD